MSHHHALQNGSDIRGIAIATDEFAVNLTPQATKEIVRGLIHWLTQKPELAQAYQEGQLKIGIGRDNASAVQTWLSPSQKKRCVWAFSCSTSAWPLRQPSS